MNGFTVDSRRNLLLLLSLCLAFPVDADGSERGPPIIAVDSIGLGPGELCYYITAREASFTLEESFAAVDAGIVGKVDSITTAGGAGGER